MSASAIDTRLGTAGPDTANACACPLFGELHELGVLLGPCTGEPVGLVCEWCIEHDCDGWSEALGSKRSRVAEVTISRVVRVVIDGDEHPGSGDVSAGDTLGLGGRRRR